MKLRYADPPYIGQAKRHYNHDPSGIVAEEVDYPALIRQLKYADGWALSASSPSIFQLVPMINEVFPIGTVRVGAWVKPFAGWKPTHRVHHMSPGPNRSRDRAVTYTGIANAMADQWGCL
jgi:hypothetical protein